MFVVPCCGLWESGKLLAVGYRGTQVGLTTLAGATAPSPQPGCPIVGTTSRLGRPTSGEPMGFGSRPSQLPIGSGTQHLPAAAWIDTEDQALALIGRMKQRGNSTLSWRAHAGHGGAGWLPVWMSDEWPAVRGCHMVAVASRCRGSTCARVEIPGFLPK